MYRTYCTLAYLMWDIWYKLKALEVLDGFELLAYIGNRKTYHLFQSFIDNGCPIFAINLFNEYSEVIINYSGATTCIRVENR